MKRGRLSNKRNLLLCPKHLWMLLLLVPTMLLAQPSRYTVSLSCGYSLPNSEEWSYVSSVTTGIAATVAWQLADSTYWAPLRHNPLLGLRLEWLHAINDIAGERYGMQGFIQQPLWTSSDQRHQLAWTLDGGLAFFTKPYRRTFDDTNIFIGSYTNCLIGLGLQMTSQVCDHGAISYGFRFCHSSNGYLRKPNQGLNYIQAEIAYTFLSHGRLNRPVNSHNGKTQGEQPSTPSHLIPPPSHLYVSYAPGLVQARNGISDELYFYTYTAQVGYLFNLSPIRAVGANIDMMFNYSHLAIADNEGYGRPFPLYVGVAGNYETSWDRLMMRLSVGTYLVKSKLITMPIYERVGIYYRFGNRLHQYAGVSFKAHYAHVDYIEWTYGIELW